jgi:DNA-binding response OmpR family regulator
LHGKKVLIVEDDFLTAEGLSHTIADYGFTVVDTENLIPAGMSSAIG